MYHPRQFKYGLDIYIKWRGGDQQVRFDYWAVGFYYTCSGCTHFWSHTVHAKELSQPEQPHLRHGWRPFDASCMVWVHLQRHGGFHRRISKSFRRHRYLEGREKNETNTPSLIHPNAPWEEPGDSMRWVVIPVHTPLPHRFNTGSYDE